MSSYVLKVGSSPEGPPAWRTSQTAQTWVEIPVNAALSTLNPRLIEAINPNFPARPEYMSSDTTSWQTTFGAWNGATYDEDHHELGFPLQGGHADYAGNDYWVFRMLHGDWVRRSNPSGWDGTVTTNDGQEATGVYSDGRARSIHSYNKPVYASLDESYWIPVLGNTSWSGAAGTFDTVRIAQTDGTHTRYGPASSTIAAAPSGGGGCYDPTRGSKGSLWWFGQGGSRFGRFDIASTTWFTGANIGARGGYMALCYLPGHDLILLASDNAPRWAVYDPVAETITNITVSGTAAGSVTDFGHAQPVYCAADDRVYWWNNPSGSTVAINYMVVPDDPKADSWTIAQTTADGTNAVTPSARQANGTYGRFAYSNFLDGFVLTNNVEGPVYFYARADL